MTSHQTKAAPIGTETQRGTRTISSAVASPANSAIVLPRLVTSSSIIRYTVALTPNSSRIRSARPLPVTTPRREHISCTTNSAIATGITVHSSR